MEDFNYFFTEFDNLVCDAKSERYKELVQDNFLHQFITERKRGTYTMHYTYY